MFKTYNKQIKLLFSIMFISEIANQIKTPIFTIIFFSSSVTLFSDNISLAAKAMLFGTFILIFQLCSCLASPLLGAASDVIGRKKALLFSSFILLLLPVGTLYAFWIKNYILFVTIFSIFALLYSINTVSIAEISDASTATTRIKNNSLAQFFIAFGAFIGPVIGGFLMEKPVTSIPFFLPFFIIFILAAMTLFLIFFFYQESLSPTTKRNKITFKPLFHLLYQGKFIVLILLLILDQLVWGSYYRYSAVVAQVHFHFSPINVGIFTGALALFVVIASGVLLPFLTRFLTHRQLLFYSILMMILGTSMMILSLHLSLSILSLIFLWMASFLVASGDVLIFCLILSHLQTMVDHSLQGSVVGVAYIIGNGMWAINGFISGLLMAYSLSDIFIFNLVLAFLLLLLYFVVPKHYLNTIQK